MDVINTMESELIDGLIKDLFFLKCIVGCSCLTKTHEVTYHSEQCPYRLASAAHTKLIQIKQENKIKNGN